MQVLQNKLEEKQNECEELMNAMHKTRSEALRRQDLQRAESEERVATLLAQLRAAEARLMETSTSLRKSHDVGLARTSINSSFGYTPLASVLRKSDAELSVYVQQLQNDHTTESGEHKFQKELLLRWQNEKERREALEKRNAELIRELRALKSNVANVY